MKVKQLTIKGKKFHIIKITPEKFLCRIQKTVDSKKGQYCIIDNDKIVYLFDNFFVWLKNNEYVYFYQNVFIKTRFFRKDGLKSKNLIKWKNKNLGEKNDG